MPPNTQGSVNVLVNPVVNTQAWNRVARQFPLGKISADLNQFQASLDASVARVGAFAISAGALGGTARIIRDLTTSFIDVQKTLIEINSIFGLSQRSISSFGKDLFNVARQTASSFEDVAAAAQEFARQGLSVTETAKRTADAMTLAKLSGIETAAAVQTLTAAVNGFSKEAITTTTIVDKLATVDAAFAVSTQDLAAGLSRVGDVAQGAGVSLDELLASVTAVQQRTSRGGAVIGNGLKSIFTRLQRSNVRESLESLGVATTNAAGEFRGAIPILDDYAKKYNTLTDAQRAFADEQIAGVYQINTLKALLSDMSSEYGSFSEAVNTAKDSAGSAARRLAELSTSTAAMVSRTGTSLKELAAVAGEDLFGPVINKTLTAVGTLSDKLKDNLSGEEVTAFGQITKRVFEDLGKYIAGPGLVAGLVIIGSLFARVAGDAANALRSIGQTISGTQQRKDLEESIVQTIRGSIDLQARLAKVSGDEVREKAEILSYLKQQLQVTQQIVSLQSRGIIGGIASKAKYSGKGNKREVISYAGGYVNTTPEEMMIAQGIGGARKNDRPKVIKNFNYGNGKRGTVVANTGEYFVPNFGGGSAIFNRDMVKEYGLPKGAKKINAAGGYVPNFALPKTKKLGEGAFGSFFQYLNPKYNHLGHKDLRKSDNSPNINEMVKDEFEASSKAYELLKNNPLVTAPRVIGSLNRSIARRRVGKEVVPGGSLLDHIRRLQTEGNDGIKWEVDRLGKEGYNIAERSGLRMYDTNNGNIALQSGNLDEYLADIFYTKADYQSEKIPLSTIRKSYKNERGAQSDKTNRRDSIKSAISNIQQNRVWEIDDKIPEFMTKHGIKLSIIDPSMAGGYTPLTNAISREASVRPKSSIRINQSPSLASGTNPLGLAVTNTIDEPRGLLDVPNRGKGYVPNFAKKRKLTQSEKDAAAKQKAEVKEALSKTLQNQLEQERINKEREALQDILRNNPKKAISQEEELKRAEQAKYDQSNLSDEERAAKRKAKEELARQERLATIKLQDELARKQEEKLKNLTAGIGSTTAGYTPPTAQKVPEQVKTAAEATKQAATEAKKATETIKKETKTRAKTVKQKEEIVAKEETIAKQEQKVTKVKAQKVKSETKTAASEEKAAKQSISKQPKKKQSSLTPDANGNFLRKDGVRVDAKGRVLPKIKPAPVPPPQRSILEELMDGSSKGAGNQDISKVISNQTAENFDPKRNTAFGRDASRKTRISSEDYDKYTNNNAEEKKKAEAKKRQEKIDRDNLRSAEKAKLAADRLARKAAADAARAANESKKIADKLAKEAAKKAADAAKQAAADAARIARQASQSQRQQLLQTSQRDAALTRDAKSYVNPRSLGIGSIGPRTADEQAIRDRRADILKEQRVIINANRRKEKRREQWSQEEQARQEAQEALEQIAEQREKLRERAERRRQVPRQIGPMTPEQQREYRNQRNARARELRAQRSRRPENANRGIGGWARRNQTALGGAAFFLPSLIAGGIESFQTPFDESRSTNADEIKSRRQFKGGTDVAVQGIQGALTGAAIGGLKGGLVGAAIGLGIAFSDLIKSTNSLAIQQTVAQNQLSQINSAISATSIVRNSARGLEEARSTGNVNAIENAQNAYIESLSLTSKELDAAQFNKLQLLTSDKDFAKFDSELRNAKRGSEARNLSLETQKSFGKADFSKNLLALNQAVKADRGISVLNTPTNNPIDGFDSISLGDLLNKNGGNIIKDAVDSISKSGREKQVYVPYIGTTTIQEQDTKNITDAKAEIKSFLEILGREVPEYAEIGKQITAGFYGSEKEIDDAVKSFRVLRQTLEGQASTEQFAKEIGFLNDQITKSSTNISKFRAAIASNFEASYAKREFAANFRQNLLSKTSSNIGLLQQGGLVAPSVGDNLSARIREEQATLSLRSDVNPKVLEIRDAISGFTTLGNKQKDFQSRIDSIAAANPKTFSESDAQLSQINALIADVAKQAPEQVSELTKIAAIIENLNKNSQQSLTLEEEYLKSQKRFSELVARAQAARNFGQGNLTSDKESIQALKSQDSSVSGRLKRKDAFGQLFSDRSGLPEDLQQRLAERDRRTGILGRLTSLAGTDITGKSKEQIAATISSNTKGLDGLSREAIESEMFSLFEEFNKDYKLSFTDALKKVTEEEIKLREKLNQSLAAPSAAVPNAASGYNAVGKEIRAIQKGVGGAKKGDKPYVISKFNYGNGKRGPIVANTGEKHIKGSGADSILNRDMMNAAGGIDKLDEYEEILAGMKNFPEITAKRDAYESSNPKVREARIRKENLAKNPDYYSPLDLDLGDFKNLPGAEGAVAAKKAREDARAKAEFTNKATSAAFDSIDLGNFKNLPGSAEARAKKEASLTKKQIEEQKRAANLKLNPDYYSELPSISDGDFEKFIKDPKNANVAGDYFKNAQSNLATMKPAPGATQDQINKYYDEVARIGSLKDKFTTSQNDSKAAAPVAAAKSPAKAPTKYSPEFLAKYGANIGVEYGGTRKAPDLSKYRLSPVQMATKDLKSYFSDTVYKNQYFDNPNMLIGSKTSDKINNLKSFLKEKDGAQSKETLLNVKNELDAVSRTSPEFAKIAPSILQKYTSGDVSGASDLFKKTGVGRASESVDRTKDKIYSATSKFKEDYLSNFNITNPFGFTKGKGSAEVPTEQPAKPDPIASSAGLPDSAKNDAINVQEINAAVASLKTSIEELAKKLAEVEEQKVENEKRMAEIRAKSEAATKTLIETAAKNGIIITTPIVTVNADGVKGGAKPAPSPGGVPST